MIDIRNLSRRRFLELSGAAGVSLGLSQAGLIGTARAADPLPAVAEEDAVIAFGYVGPTSDEGWTWTHEQGRQAVQEAFPKAKTIFVENIPYSADASRTFRQFVSEGANMVITNSNYGDFMYDIAKNAPETAFLHCDDRTMMDNMGVFYPSHWYPSYVTGVAAGMMTKTNKLGYIAAVPVPTTFTGSNAFLMGARSVKPDATLQVIVINSWFDPQASTQAARALLDNGADVLFGIMDEPGYLQVAEQRGAKAVMLNTDSRKYGPNAYVSSIMFDFRKFYVDQVRARLEGKWTPGQYLLPFGDGTDRDVWGETVPADAAKAGDEAREKILGGWKPFVGELKDNKGEVKIAAGQEMTETDLYNWNWSIDGISGL
jgi:basic membrane lipoprotein Med (substrate-binding protein (PBP1-ABC) superfamily)